MIKPKKLGFKKVPNYSLILIKGEQRYENKYWTLFCSKNCDKVKIVNSYKTLFEGNIKKNKLLKIILDAIEPECMK